MRPVWVNKRPACNALVRKSMYASRSVFQTARLRQSSADLTVDEHVCDSHTVIRGSHTLMQTAVRSVKRGFNRVASFYLSKIAGNSFKRVKTLRLCQNLTQVYFLVKDLIIR